MSYSCLPVYDALALILEHAAQLLSENMHGKDSVFFMPKLWFKKWKTKKNGIFEKGESWLFAPFQQKVIMKANIYGSGCWAWDV